MPRYKVVLEFDHPGDKAPVRDKDGGTYLSPDHWRLDQFLGDECKRVRIEVWQQSTWNLLKESYYQEGCK